MKNQKIISLLVAISSFSLTLTPNPSFAGPLPNIGKPDGYFPYGNMMYAKSGGSICGFLNPGHFEIFRRSYPASDVKIKSISSYKNLGACSVPEAYFNNGVTVFYSFGDGRVCAFLTQQERDEWENRYSARDVGKISSFPPSTILKNIGQCPTN